MSAKMALGWPSAGFYVLLGTHCILVGMLCWAWQRPALDEVFEILARREMNPAVEFSAREVAVLQRSWDRHPGLGRPLLGKSTARFLEPTESGWLSRSSAHLALSPEADRSTVISLEARGAPTDFPLVVKIRGSGADRQVELMQKQPKQIEWPAADLKLPRILDVEVTAAQPHNATAPTWAVRVSSSPTARETP